MTNSPKWDADYISFWKNLKHAPKIKVLSIDLGEFPGCDQVYKEM